jgi:RNA polymerase sigma-70 factor (ECF subfamily)
LHVPHDPDRSEGDLVEAARAGDPQAFTELIRAHQRVAFRVAWSILGSSSDAEDVVQDAFVKAWRHLHRFRAGSPWRPWLLRIVANEAKNRIRGRTRRIRRETAVAVPDLADDDPAGSAIASDRSRRLYAAMNELPERDRSVVICRYLLDLTEHETSEVLGVPRGTVKSRLNRAKSTLARALEPMGDKP